MSTEDNQPRARADHPAARLVHQALAEMHDARRTFRQAAVVDRYSSDVHQRFEGTVVSAYDELHPYRTGAMEMWKEMEIDRIPELANRKVPVKDSNKSGGVVQTRGEATVEKVHVPIPGQQLIQFSHDIDECAREIGFTVDFGEEDVQSPEPF